MTPPSRHISWTVWPQWAAASAVVNGVGAVAYDWPVRMPRDVPSAPSMITGGLVLTGGLIMLTLPAILQWLVHRNWLRGSGWWVLARSIGSFGAIHVYSFVARDDAFRFFLGGLVSGALSGAVAGLALVWLLRNSAERLRDDTRLLP